MSTLRDKIAQVVADHRVGGKALTPNEDDYVLADALLPLIREVQAEALEEAATAMPLYLRGTYDGGAGSTAQPEWLRRRAAAYRHGEEDSNGQA